MLSAPLHGTRLRLGERVTALTVISVSGFVVSLLAGEV